MAVITASPKNFVRLIELQETANENLFTMRKLLENSQLSQIQTLVSTKKIDEDGDRQEKTQIEYKESTTFYLFTDGFADQFGGPNGKKFKYKQFSDLLVKNNNLSQNQQADIINKAFSDWKGDLEQVDDVCVIGIKL